MNKFIKRGGLWVLGQFSLMSMVVVAGIWCSGEWGLGWWLDCVVFLLLGIGVIFLVGGFIGLGRFFTVFPRPLCESELVSSGVYGVVRHPFYTSVFFCALAWSMWWNSGLAIGLWMFTVFFLDAKARYEEKMLREKFKDYSDYAKRVKRLIPWLY